MSRFIGALALGLIGSIGLACGGIAQVEPEHTLAPFDGGLDSSLPEASSPDSTPDAAADAPHEACAQPMAPIVWTACEAHAPHLSGVECATVSVPLSEFDHCEESIPLKVQRLRSRTQPARGQLWLVQGGPGEAASWTFGTLIDLVHNDWHWDFDLYLVDHRGTGDNDHLSCPDLPTGGQPSVQTLQECVSRLQQKWGAKLPYYSTTESARDLGRLIEQTREPGRKVFLYGDSYGTYHLLRYLQLYPSQADGVILDSIATPGISFTNYNKTMDQAVHTLFARCGQDPFCSSKLGSDPYSALLQVETMIQNGHCSGLRTTAAALKNAFVALMYEPSWAALLPAITYRLQRCNPADIRAVGNLLAITSPTTISDSSPVFSPALYFHVILSELWDTPSPSQAAVQSEFDQLPVAGQHVLALASAASFWPRYDPAPYDEKWPVSSVPMLMLNGELDPVTPLSRAQQMKDHFHGPNQTLVAFRNTGHGVLGYTPTLGSGPDCGRSIVEQFLSTPTAPLDTSCEQNLYPLSFVGDASAANMFLNTSDAWGDGSRHNPLPTSPANTSALPKRIRRQPLPILGPRL